MAEELYFHLFEFTRTESKVARRNLVAKTLADLSNAEGNFDARAIAYILEFTKMPCAVSGRKNARSAFATQRADRRGKHQIEVARRR